MFGHINYKKCLGRVKAVGWTAWLLLEFFELEDNRENTTAHHCTKLLFDGTQWIHSSMNMTFQNIQRRINVDAMLCARWDISQTQPYLP